MATLGQAARCSASRAAVHLATAESFTVPAASASLLAAGSTSTARAKSLEDSICLRLKHTWSEPRRPLSSASRARGRGSSRQTCAARRGVSPLVTSYDSVPVPRYPEQQLRQYFHTYFVTHLPSSSLHPDSHRTIGPGHKLPRDASTPHTPSPGSSPAVSIPNMQSRDLTVVRIPLRRAKHHFGSATARGSRPYNEDTDQAGTVDIPAFAKRGPMSVRQKPGEATPADSVLGDPQIFYFGVFDGHGGTQCSHFLRDELHGYVEEAAIEFGLQSSLRKSKPGRDQQNPSAGEKPISRRRALDSIEMKSAKEVQKDMEVPNRDNRGFVDRPNHGVALASAESPPAESQNVEKAIQLERELVKAYGTTIGGYFRRFNPEHFDISSDASKTASITVESSLAYAFLRADLDFVSAQARKADPDDSDMPLNDDEILGAPHATPSGHGIGGSTRFKGGSTASVALISTPTTAPFWHPAANSTLVAAHVGDSRILLCETATGLPLPLTSDHHPSTPTESRRLRRYAPAGSMVSGDSFGEERIAGLANSRAFGDIKSKRIGVSAEPEITRVEMGPAQYSFLVLMSDGVSGTLSDQEIVDVVKEARTPEEGARNVVEYATEVSKDGDNATCQVVRLGGWERRSEGGLGSMGTKEIRDIRKAEAQDPRRGKR
ncbi:protein phosphatase 2c [Pochonia chlamydosporia 170]|uniref:Protein phosphatase 2c n=1 Tax=Pochonia chlamydosporia 170 TaxID=1380566 RepID=A0A179G7A8_METCM|nr:protein phosphatase 2c [Pochonia chlamydosporia 170]OAQ73059.1 protein phosphatase 2c [Pochonia chlamydosporia 170]